MTILTIIGNVLIAAGALVFTTAALGLLRFPDAYTRISAVGTAGGIGIILVVTGALLHQPTIPDVIKVLLIIALQLTTSAIGSIAIARSAYLVRTPLRRSSYNELTENTDDNERPG
jgi:multicomponent Na+:H+ antiporter subunit G